MPKPDAVVAYVPVVHSGYLKFFKHFNGTRRLLILGNEAIADEDYLRKELRAVAPHEAAKLVASLDIFDAVIVATKQDLAKLNDAHAHVALPDEDISRRVAEKYLPGAEVEFYPVFLRWDRQNVEGANNTEDDIRTSSSKQDVMFMQQAFSEAQQSPDIWRHVGAALARDGEILKGSSNQPLTTQNTPWAEGDPRALFNRGVGIEMSTFMHAEARLIAWAAHEGVSLKGSTMYVTTFPCPACAMLIAQSGVSRCCFAEGYAVLDGRRVLEESGVELMRVDVETPNDKRILIPYPEKPQKR